MAQIDPNAASNAFWGTVENLNALDQRKALRVAGSALASGDRTGATAGLYEAGLLNEAGAIERADATRAQRERESRIADREERVTWLGQATEALLQLPEAERQAVYEQQIRPTLLQMGFDEAGLQVLDSGAKTDANLRSFGASLGAELSKPWEDDVAGPNGSRLRPTAGGYEEVYAAPFDPFDGAQAGYRWTDNTRTRQEPIPGSGADPERAGALAASRRAPPRARSGGGGSGGGGSSAPRVPSASSTGRGSSLPPGFRVRN